ncbi:MAG: type II toxin-antitoxin system RelE/ParE family toxin [Byssovorax sp.]
MRVDLSPEAIADLEEIACYIARDNPRAAETWVDRLIDRAEKAGVQPKAGRIVPEYGEANIREVFLRTYRIIYRIDEDEHRIVVLTVLEGHRRLRGARR